MSLHLRKSSARLVLTLVFILSGLLSANTLYSQVSYNITYLPSSGRPYTGGPTLDATTTGYTTIVNGPTANPNSSWHGPFTLPFAFDFYGAAVTDYYVSDNGLMTFSTPTTTPPTGNNSSLPTTDLPDNTIAALWDSPNNTATGTNDNIWIRTYGTAPDRSFVVMWYSFAYGSGPSTSSFNYVEIVLEETTNRVIVGEMYNNGNVIASTIGLQQNATTAVEYSSTHDSQNTQNKGANSTDNDQFIFDPFNLQPNDGLVSAIEAPFNGGCISSSGGTDSVRIEFTSSSTTPLSNIPVYYSFDGGAPVAGTIAGPVATNTTVSYTFPTPITVPGGAVTYPLEAWCEIPGDPDTSNDTTELSFQTKGLVNTFPYFEDFESGPGSWEIELNATAIINSSWAFGTPDQPPFVTAASGDSCFFNGDTPTDQYNANEASWAYLRCLDLSTVNIPIFEASIYLAAEGTFDGMILQSSVDGGASWQDVGAVNSTNPDALNWYNQGSLGGFLGGAFWNSNDAWDGAHPQAPGWFKVRHELVGLENEPDVQLRFAFASDGSVQNEGAGFDDVLIYDKPDIDLRALQVVGPASSCDLSTNEQVTIRIENGGAQPQSNFTVGYILNPGNIIVTETFTGTINPNDIAEYTFTTTEDFSTPNTYEIFGFTDIANDTVFPGNDTTDLYQLFNVVPVASFPFLDDFESGAEGWSTDNPDLWRLGTPNNGTAPLPPGVNAWTTSPGYEANETGSVISRCYDFSSLGSPGVKFDIAWDIGFADGVVLQYSLDGGTTWTRLGDVGDGKNWYNQTNITSNPGGQSQAWGSGSTGFAASQPWLTATYAAPELANEPDVRFRFAFSANNTTSAADEGFSFDNFQIVELPSLDLGGNQVFCFGDTLTLEVDSTIFDNVFWSTTDTTFALDVTSPAIVFAIANYQDFIVSDTVVVDFSFPTVDLGSDLDVCGTGPETLTADASGPGTFLWSTNATTQSISVSPPNQTISVTYTDTVGCTATDQVDVEFFEIPEIQLGPDQQICAGDVFVLDASTNVSPLTHDFVWSTGEQVGAIFVSSPNTYTVIATSVNGCTDTASVTVDVLPSPAVNLGQDIYECDGVIDVTLNAGNSNASSWSWSEITPGGGTSQIASTQTVDITESGVYAVRVENSVGCADEDTITVGLSNPPVVDLPSSLEGCGTVTLDAGNLGVDYLWTTLETASEIEVSSSGTYGVTVIDQFGCEATASIDVTVTPIPDVAFYHPSSIFVLDSVQFIDNTVPVGDSFEWDFGTGDVSTQQNPVYVFQDAGNFPVTLTVTEGNCQASFTDTITVDAFTDRNEYAALSDLQVYPNPTDGIVQLTGTLAQASAGQVILFDANAREIRRQRFDATTQINETIDLTGAAAGVYFVIVEAGENRAQFKLIKSE